MSMNLSLARMRLLLAGALLFCGMCLPLASSSIVSARAASFSPPNLDFASIETVAFETLPNNRSTADDLAVRIATSKFIRGLHDGDASAVWSFASEEDQEAFATKPAVLQAFAETFPELARTRTAIFESIVRDGDNQVVTLRLRDAAGATHRARIGLWLDDANDWKVVSCDVVPSESRAA
jgi:hypothetical protein